MAVTEPERCEMLLSELLGALEEKKAGNYHETEINGLSYDSRVVEPGWAFFSIKGLVTDGHLFATQAVERGAAALFLEREIEQEVRGDVVVVRVPDTRLALAHCSTRFSGEPSRILKLVGITGTNGKTTTAFLVENICRKAKYTTGLIGTVDTHIGDLVEPVTRTTPESLDLQRLLRRMVDSGVQIAAMEVSSHALDLSRVNGCDFEVVVFTNLTQDHLDFHISLEEYFGAKRRLFMEKEFGNRRKAIINIDDPFGARLLMETKLPKRSFGIENTAEIHATKVEVSATGNRFSIEHDGKTMPLSTFLQGRFNVYNCLAAAGVAIELGIDDESIREGLESLKGVPGRFESIECGQEFTVIVDYAHTPDGIRSLLEACREVAEGRVILVVGCGGDRDRSKRPLMGRAGVEMSDSCIITSDNPRSEEPMAIIEMVLEGIRGLVSPERYAVQPDRRMAICEAIGEARRGDLVVIAGKGHESGQIFADRVVPFDDRQVVREALEEVGSAQS